MEEVKARRLAKPLDEAGVKRLFVRGASAALVLQLRAPELVATPVDLARYPTKVAPIPAPPPAPASASMNVPAGSSSTGMSDSAHKDPYA